MRSLVWKELRSLVPFMWLIAFLLLMTVLDIFISGFPDRHGLSEFLDQPDSAEATAIGYFVMAFVLGMGLLVREKDENTLEYLDSLPLSRARIYGVKVGLAFLLLCTMPLFGVLIVIAVQALSRDSLVPGFHADILWAMVTVEVLMCWVYLGFSLALSFLRRFSLLVIGLLFILYFALRKLGVPGAAALNLFSIFDYSYEGQQLVFPWRQLSVMLVFGVVGYVISFIAFIMQGDRLARLAGVLERNRLKTPLIALGTALIGLLWFILFAIWGAGLDEEDYAENERPEGFLLSWSTTTLVAPHFEFVCPDNLRSRGMELVNGSEKVTELISGFLGTEPMERISVDLSSPMRHAAGTAHWKKINMSLASSDDPQKLLSILAHETVHVYLEHMSDHRIGDVFGSTRFFHEGLASYLEYRLFMPEGAVAPLRRSAAAAYHLKQAEFDDLVEDAVFSARFDPNLVYALGEVFVLAVVKQYGDEAPGNLVRAFNRDDAPENLGGMALWRDVFQACGYSLAAAVDEYYTQLQALEEKHRAFVDRVPEFGASLGIREGEVGVKPDAVELPEGWEWVCRFRDARDTASDEFLTPRLRDGGFWVDDWNFGGRSLWYQLGVMSGETELPVFNKWVRVRFR